MEAKTLLGSLSLLDDCLGDQSGLAADAAPGVGIVVIVDVGEVGLGAVAHVEEVAKEPNVLAHLAVAQKRRHGDLKVLSQKI